MNDVETLIAEAEKSSSVAYTRFVLLVDKCGDSPFYYFVEGKDAPYYHPRIQSISKKESIPIKCVGKSKVLEVHLLLSNQSVYDKYQKAFFVDNDYDDNSAVSSDIYITPCYSIENLYVSQATIGEILKCEFDILPSDENYAKILNFYNTEQQVFHNAILEFNAWYACLKKLTPNTGVSLNDNMPPEFLNLQIGNIAKTYTLEDIEEKFQEATLKIERDDIQKMSETLNGNPLVSLRGKYQTQFLHKFLRFLIDDANNKVQRKYIIKKTTFNIEKASLLSQLSQYAITPDCLTEYVQRRLAS